MTTGHQGASESSEREAFEAQMRLQAPTFNAEILLGRSNSGNYSSLVTQHCWLAWQARAALSGEAGPAHGAVWCACEPTRCQGIGKCRWHAMDYSPTQAARAALPAPADQVSPDLWQPLETAPHGIPVLVQFHAWNDRSKEPMRQVAWFFEGEWRECPRIEGKAWAERWMHIPTNADAAVVSAQHSASDNSERDQHDGYTNFLCGDHP